MAWLSGWKGLINDLRAAGCQRGKARPQPEKKYRNEKESKSDFPHEMKRSRRFKNDLLNPTKKRLSKTKMGGKKSVEEKEGEQR